MRDVLGRVMNGQEVTIEEAFELVNQYDYTMLDATLSGGQRIRMNVNKFEKYQEKYAFSPECSLQEFEINQSDILSAKTTYKEDLDVIFIDCQMSNGVKLHFTIHHIKDGEKAQYNKNLEEVDVYTVQEMLTKIGEEGDWWKFFGASNVMSCNLSLRPEVVYIDDSEDKLLLHISDGGNKLEVELFDDSCNTFYCDMDTNRFLLYIKPYGQPFGDIRLFCYKHSQESGVADN